MLVLGCGYHYPEVILFFNALRYAVGLDVKNTFYKNGIVKTFRTKKKERNAFTAFLGTAVTRYIYQRYYQHLEKISGIKIDHKQYNLLSYDGSRMPFKNMAFDVVLSNAVLEYAGNLEQLVQEIYRVTKKEGISYHLWHNFYSFSGSHASKFICRRYPWGHLRAKYETHGLNRFTPTDIQNIFSKHFDIIALYQIDKNHWKKGYDSAFQFEEESLLTESIKKELIDFPIEMLLTRSYLIICRKRV